MKSSTKSTLTVSLALLSIVVPVVIGCNGSITDNGGDATYQLTGTLSSDYSRGVTLSAVVFTRDSEKRPGAAVALGATSYEFGRTLFPIDSVFSIATTSASTFRKGTYALTFADSSSFADTLSVTVPDTFSILTITPASRIVQGVRSVSLTWSGATNASGYIMAAVKRGSIYTGTGYSLYCTSLNTAGTIPADAFLESVGTEPDTGWYYIYVYAYAGVPDSAIGRSILPTTLPSQLADNITGTKLNGHFGSIVVARRDSVHVVVQP